MSTTDNAAAKSPSEIQEKHQHHEFALDTIKRLDIARAGNGNNEELSLDQLEMIQELYDRMSLLRKGLHPHDRDFLDHETCRRYLVARSWSLKKAEEQLASTLHWRVHEDPAGKEFWQSSKSLKDPLALSMRIVGLDKGGRPIGYTCFREAHDRFDADDNLEHTQLIMEAFSKVIRMRRHKGYNQRADSRQCVWVVDFDGFSFRDQNPKTAVVTARLLQHHPEMLYTIILLNPPFIFNALWQFISPYLDARVRNKIMFVKGIDAAELLRERLGQEAAEWIAMETKDNKEKQADAKRGNPKRYWIPPTEKGQHDARGMATYVHSDLYIKTPGDAYEERKANIEHHVAVTPRVVRTLYKGRF